MDVESWKGGPGQKRAAGGREEQKEAAGSYRRRGPEGIPVERELQVAIMRTLHHVLPQRTAFKHRRYDFENI
jgi:hypothetical protein